MAAKSPRIARTTLSAMARLASLARRLAVRRPRRPQTIIGFPMRISTGPRWGSGPARRQHAFVPTMATGNKRSLAFMASQPTPVRPRNHRRPATWCLRGKYRTARLFAAGPGHPRASPGRPVAPSRSTASWPVASMHKLMSRRPGLWLVKYSDLAAKVTGRVSISGRKTESITDRWLEARMAPPVSGMFSPPTTWGCHRPRRNGPAMIRES